MGETKIGIGNNSAYNCTQAVIFHIWRPKEAHNTRI